MAKDDTESQEIEEESGSKKLIIIIAAVVVLALVGVGAFLALGSSKGGDGEDDEEFEDEYYEEEADDSLPSAVLPLETFIVNLQVKGSFLKTSLQLEFAEPELPPTVENDIPKIRDTVIRVLSGKTSADILTSDGKDQLRDEIRDGINETLGAEDVTRVFFTEFIIQ